MNTYNNKLIVRRYFEEVLLNGRFELIEELFAPEICDLVRRYAFFAPESFAISDMVAEGDTCDGALAYESIFRCAVRSKRICCLSSRRRHDRRARDDGLQRYPAPDWRGSIFSCLLKRYFK